MGKRKRFSERDVLETLWYQGYDIRCFRCGVALHSATELKPKIEREHLVEVALGGVDRPINCRYSCAPCHKKVTFGTKATTAGSSIQRIAKAERIARGGKTVKRPMAKSIRKLSSRAFQKGHRALRAWGKP